MVSGRQMKPNTSTKAHICISSSIDSRYRKKYEYTTIKHVSSIKLLRISLPQYDVCTILQVPSISRRGHFADRNRTMWVRFLFLHGFKKDGRSGIYDASQQRARRA